VRFEKETRPEERNETEKKGLDTRAALDMPGNPCCEFAQ
jgi:hypothetical protein